MSWWRNFERKRWFPSHQPGVGSRTGAGPVGPVELQTDKGSFATHHPINEMPYGLPKRH
jgi:hypothetical protein